MSRTKAPIDAAAIESAMCQASLDALVALDTKGRVIAWAWGAEVLFGIPGADAVGALLTDLIVPDEGKAEANAAFSEALETGYSIYETTQIRRGGAPLRVQVVHRALPAGGERILATAIRDITEAKRLEQELSDQVWSLTSAESYLESILASSGDYAIIALDLHGVIESWNEGARADFGHASADAKGRLLSELLDLPHLVDTLRGARDVGLCTEEFEPLAKEGRRFPARVSISVRRDGFDAPVGFVVVTKDVTLERRAEEERRLAYERLVEIERLQAVNRFKTQLLNTASHELNTPITPIKMQMHLLKSSALGPLNPKQARAVEVLDRNITRLAALVRDVLDVARLENGHMRISKTRADLARIVVDAVESFEERARQAGIELKVEAESEILVEADASRLTQVVFNLLSNATKFTPRSGTVSVTLRREGAAALLEVRDSGIGLKAEDIGRLFQPFTQVHDTMQTTEPGTGLGLHISRGIVEQHGGVIGCESDGMGTGSCFWVRLPLAPSLDVSLPTSRAP